MSPTEKGAVWFEAYRGNYHGTGLMEPQVIAEQAWQSGYDTGRGENRAPLVRALVLIRDKTIMWKAGSGNKSALLEEIHAIAAEGLK